jgi:hypothetical protein
MMSFFYLLLNSDSPEEQKPLSCCVIEVAEIENLDVETLEIEDDDNIRTSIEESSQETLELPIEENLFELDHPAQLFKTENITDEKSLSKIICQHDDSWKDTTKTTSTTIENFDTVKNSHGMSGFETVDKVDDETTGFVCPDNSHLHSGKLTINLDGSKEFENTDCEIVIDVETVEQSIYNFKPSYDKEVKSKSSERTKSGKEDENSTQNTSSLSIEPSSDVISSNDVIVFQLLPQQEDLPKSKEEGEIKNLANEITFKEKGESPDLATDGLVTCSTKELENTGSASSTPNTANELRQPLKTPNDQTILGSIGAKDVEKQQLTMSQQNLPSLITQQIYLPNSTIPQDHSYASNSGNYFTVSFIFILQVHHLSKFLSYFLFFC